jgi:hypothetical protein
MDRRGKKSVKRERLFALFWVGVRFDAGAKLSQFIADQTPRKSELTSQCYYILNIDGADGPHGQFRYGLMVTDADIAPNK